jgi:hypothetical protein
MSCPRCGAASQPTDKFCQRCGSALGPDAIAQSPAASVAATAAQATPTAPAAPPLPPAPLHAIPTGGLTPDDVVAWLQSAGYAAKIVIGDSGNPHVSSATQGFPFHVFMHDAQGDRYASVRIAVGFATHGKFDITQMNAWNAGTRWCRGYYDGENDPWIETDIDLYPGGTYESLNDQFGAWNNTLGNFVKKFGLS